MRKLRFFGEWVNQKMAVEFSEEVAGARLGLEIEVVFVDMNGPLIIFGTLVFESPFPLNKNVHL